MTGSSGDSIDRDAVRRNSRRLVLFLAGLALVGVLGGALAGVLAGGDEHPGRTHRHSPLGLVLVVGILLLALALCLLLLRLFLRRSSFRAVMQFGWFERRAAYKAAKAGRPLSDREIRVVRASLAFLEGAAWSLWLWPALVVLWVLNSLSHHGPVRWLMLTLATAYALLWPFAVRERRRVIARYHDALARAESSGPASSPGL